MTLFYFGASWAAKSKKKLYITMTMEEALPLNCPVREKEIEASEWSIWDHFPLRVPPVAPSPEERSVTHKTRALLPLWKQAKRINLFGYSLFVCLLQAKRTSVQFTRADLSEKHHTDIDINKILLRTRNNTSFTAAKVNIRFCYSCVTLTVAKIYLRQFFLTGRINK